MIFEGFPVEAQEFFRGLRKNNSKQWFEAHRDVYETAVKEPMIKFVMDMGEQLYKFAPEFIADPRLNGSLYKIHRDTRFSPNKIPYKTHAAAIFWHNEGKKHETGGYYFEFDENDYYAGGGIYMPDNTSLTRIRRYIAAHPAEFKAIINNKKFKSIFGEVEGERLQRPPRGFSPDHPLIEYIKMKQYLVGVGGKTDKTLHTREIFEHVLSLFKTMTPFIKFINKGLGLTA